MFRIPLGPYPVMLIRFIVMEVEYKDEVSPFKDDQLVLFMCQGDILLLSILHPVKPFLQLIECLVEVLQE